MNVCPLCVTLPTEALLITFNITAFNTRHKGNEIIIISKIFLQLNIIYVVILKK
jgi:hypothetical protein